MNSGRLLFLKQKINSRNVRSSYLKIISGLTTTQSLSLHLFEFFEVLVWNYIRNLPQNLWRRKTNLRSNPMFYVKFPIRTGLAWKIRPNHFILRDCGDQWAVFIMEWCSWLVTRIRKYDLKVLHKHLARNVLFRRTMCTIHVFAHKRDVKERFLHTSRWEIKATRHVRNYT